MFLVDWAHAAASDERPVCRAGDQLLRLPGLRLDRETRSYSPGPSLHAGSSAWLPTGPFRRTFGRVAAQATYYSLPARQIAALRHHALSGQTFEDFPLVKRAENSFPYRN